MTSYGTKEQKTLIRFEIGGFLKDVPGTAQVNGANDIIGVQ